MVVHRFLRAAVASSGYLCRIPWNWGAGCVRTGSGRLGSSATGGRPGAGSAPRCG
ncbi:hypothetical protein GS506_04910 [Rhodococcus hoagii]|nr:hypothetical protein [Prescottella equi]